MTQFEYQFPRVKYLPSVRAAASSTKLPPTLRSGSVRGRASGRVHPLHYSSTSRATPTQPDTEPTRPGEETESGPRPEDSARDRHADAGAPAGDEAAQIADTAETVEAAEPRPAGSTRTTGSDLDYLTDSDRDLIHAVTGEVFEPGQRPSDRPLSPFAMQLAVDRKNGGLSAGLEVSGAYLRRTNRLLLQLNVPSNPFSGELLERAFGYLERKTTGLLGRNSDTR